MLLGENEMSLSKRWILAGGETRSCDSICCNSDAFVVTADASTPDLVDTCCVSRIVYYVNLSTKYNWYYNLYLNIYLLNETINEHWLLFQLFASTSGIMQ